MTRLTREEFEDVCLDEFPLALEKEARRARNSEERLIENEKRLVATLARVQAWLTHPDFPGGVFAVEAAIGRAIAKTENE